MKPSSSLDTLVIEHLQSNSPRNKWRILITGINIVIGIICILVSGLMYYDYTKKEAKTDIIEPQNQGKTITKSIIIDINGAVKIPGVYSLPFESRIKDGITKAGGFTEDADSDWIAQHINLAQAIADGQKLYIPAQNEYTSDSISNVSDQNTTLLDLNTATADQLETLPKIGETMATRIVEYRNQHGSFRTLDDLLQVEGIKASMLDIIKPLVEVK